MMLLLLCVLVAFADGKDELKVISNCENTITRVVSLEDTHSGPVDSKSVITGALDSNEETKSKDPFDVKIKIDVQKYFIWGYHSLPQVVMDKIGSSLNDSKIHYVGNSVFSVTCFFKDMLNQCMPPKGSIKLTMATAPYMKKIIDKFGVMAKIANGWYRVVAKATTPWGETAFCNTVEFKLSLR